MKTIFIARQPNLFQQFAFPHFEISQDYRIIDKVLEDEKIVLELAKDIPDATTGRARTPVEQTLRLLVLKHQKGLSLRDLEKTLKENLADRWFCKVNERPPCFKTIANQFSLITDDALHRINNRIMDEARKRKLTRGKKMRVDSTVVQANIHHPTDSSLIADGIRVISRRIKRLASGAPKGFRSFQRKAKQQLKRIRTIGRKNKTVRNRAIAELMSMGRHVVLKTKNVRDTAVRRYRRALCRVIEQTEQVLKGEKPKNRIVSIFETWARPFKKGKAGVLCEFGSEVQIQEDEHFVTNWQINDRPSDTVFFPEALDNHKRVHAKPPNTVATDRGYWSPDNYHAAQRAGVKNVSMPKKGGLSEKEKQRQSTRQFKKGQRFRAGSEAKISLLKRVHGLNRSLYKGKNGMNRWVGGGIIASNLMGIARLTVG